MPLQATPVPPPPPPPPSHPHAEMQAGSLLSSTRWLVRSQRSAPSVDPRCPRCSSRSAVRLHLQGEMLELCVAHGSVRAADGQCGCAENALKKNVWGQKAKAPVQRRRSYIEQQQVNIPQQKRRDFTDFLECVLFTGDPAGKVRSGSPHEERWARSRTTSVWIFRHCRGWLLYWLYVTHMWDRLRKHRFHRTE